MINVGDKTVYVVVAEYPDARRDSREPLPVVLGVFTERWRAELAAGQLGGDVHESSLHVGDGGVGGDVS